MKQFKEFINEAQLVTWATLNIVNQNFIIDKAESQSDGIYKTRGIMYRVKDHKVTHFALVTGRIIIGTGHFNIDGGSFEGDYGWEKRAKAILKGIK